MRVLTYSDTYLPTINGVSYTISEWKKEFPYKMDVICPDHPEGEFSQSVIPVKSYRFPFYNGFRMAIPKLRTEDNYDVVHAHTPFMMGISGIISSHLNQTPFVLSYHTPIRDYTSYLPIGESLLGKVASKYQDIVFKRADRIIVPTEFVAREVRDRTDTKVTVISNGVDTDFFRPKEDVTPERFFSDYDDSLPTIGYAGRHGYEKNISLIFDQLGDKNLNIIIAGDGPANEHLRDIARDVDANTKFTGFISRDELPYLYSALDVFAFPSPVETQGKVAIESMCCGTPVVGVNDGALLQTIEDDCNGVTSEPRDFSDSVMYALSDRERLRSNCLDMRNDFSVKNSVEKLETVYEELLDDY
jgi:glycosyltransferase involved in cell wall biosynthesis